MCCWFRLLVSWECLYLYSSKILACNFLFWWYFCLVLVSGWWWLCRMTLGVSSSVFWEKLRRIGIILCIFGRICLWRHLVLDFCYRKYFWFLDYRFYFTSSDCFVQIIYFFLTQFWWAFFMAFVSKSVLTITSIVAPTFVSFLFAWNIFFYLLHFNLCVSFAQRWVSWRRHAAGSCFFIQSATLCVLIGAVSPLTLKVTDTYVSPDFTNHDHILCGTNQTYLSHHTKLFPFF